MGKKTPILNVILVGLLFKCALAHAHEGRLDRTLLLEPAGDRVVCVIHLEIRGDTHRATLFALGDTDRNHRLDDAEVEGLKQALLLRALADVRLQVDTATVSLEDVKSKLRITDEGPTELMVHGLAPWPKTAKTLHVTTTKRAEPLEVRLLSGSHRLEAAARGRRVQSHWQTRMGPDDRVWFRLKNPNPG